MSSTTIASDDASGARPVSRSLTDAELADASGIMLLEYVAPAPVPVQVPVPNPPASVPKSVPASKPPASVPKPVPASKPPAPTPTPQTQPPPPKPEQPPQQRTPTQDTMTREEYIASLLKTQDARRNQHSKLTGIAEDDIDAVSEVSSRSRTNRVFTFPKHNGKPKSVEVIADEQFQRVFNNGHLNVVKLPDTKSTVRFDPSKLANVEEGKLTLEDRSQLSPMRSFTEIREMMNTKFAYKEGRLSSTLDILSQYMRGQKILYLEAKSYCEFYLYRLMIPTIFISTACSVVGGLFAESPIMSIAVAAANGFNTLLLALINYFKLDARAEAHRMTAYGFDQLISECEFTSGKILLSNIVSDPEIDKDANKYDLKYVQEFMTSLESKVKEIKQKNQFIIPDSIRHRYQNIYYTNVFALVFQSQIQEMIITNQLKLACNAVTEVENQIIKGDRSAYIYEDYNEKLRQKNELIEEILRHRRALLLFDQQIREEVSYNQRRCCKRLRCCY